MSTSEQVLNEARKLFDAAGIVVINSDSILILGLATSPEQDLDDFLRDENDSFIIRGFEIHVQPRLDSLVNHIRQLGLSVEITGHCGYPSPNELNLKRLAVAAGLGTWGKNAMVLHPRLGPRFRLMAVKVVGARLPATGPGTDSHVENPLCQGCTACMDVCPLGILEPYYLRDRQACLADTTGQRGRKVECCDLCWKVCPVGLT